MKIRESVFQTGKQRPTGYSRPELTYRRKTMESIAEKCKQLNMCFTGEEFIDLWTTPYSDCVAIDSWHAPTAYDILQVMKSQNLKNVSVEVVIDFIKKNFVTEKNWEKLMIEYWDKAKLLV